LGTRRQISTSADGNQYESIENGMCLVYGASGVVGPRERQEETSTATALGTCTASQPLSFSAIMQRCPLELLRQVVCHVEPEGGNDSLKALSLSCRALAPLAQEAIFRVIDFADAVEATYEKLLELVSSNPALGAYARKLVFDGSQVDDIGLILTRMSELGVAPHFAQVTELALNYWTFSDRDTQDFLRCFSQFKSVRSLVFERCRFMNVDDMHTRVGCFQASLQDLALKSLGFRTVIQDTVGTVGTVQNIVERSWLLPSFCMIAVHVPTVVAWCLQNIVPSSLLSLTIKISYFKDAEATSLLFSQCTALRYLSVETDISQWVELRTGIFQSSERPRL
jgi:hypothetical protein